MHARMWFLATLLLATAAAADELRLPEPPVPPRVASGADYEQCLGMLADDPSGAAAMAEGWTATGIDRDGAAHCAALAAIELGDVQKGAQALDTLAANSPAAPLARAKVLGQATQAWVLAGEPARAYESASRALDLAPDDVDLLIDRGDVLVGLDRQTDAIEDFDRALLLDPGRSDALVLRAGALRHAGRLDGALSDVARALTLDPENADALLERGILRERTGDRAGAKADWTRAIDLDPDGEAADLAQQNLSLLEAGPEQASRGQAGGRPAMPK